MAIRFTAPAAVAFISCASLASTSAVAAENGNTQYSPGASQFFSGNVPPYPGFYLLSQTSYTSADRLNDGKGDRLPIDFDVRAKVETLRLIGVSPNHLLGGQIWGQLILPIVDLDTRVGPVSDSRTGLADSTLTGGLAWHDGKNNYVFGLDIGMNTGSYQHGRLANPGQNHWSFQPTIGYQYLDPQAWVAAASLRYIVNTKNHDTDYTSGDEVVLDYAIGYNIGSSRLSVVGYLLDQVSDDEGPGVGSDGNRGRGFAIGPSYTYRFASGPELSTSWQHETHTEHRSQGNIFWLNLALKL
ncbi:MULTISPECIES: transporter [Pseudoxanthomonas]|uniref:Phenol degradation protein meta n=1 Tax=Pseudoxanthomonas winnipegensis TaxID=2480810 RepID=A0AAW8GFA0_9GAMM|nr:MULTISPECIES: transporter [Pseudoxanthomonas]MDQ1120477.1 hypothetical protein [Pseudoxanthomonas winnipegensis]MDQ1133696.1 hypothetical protein [Pseudoxanthomonas winnipegensis]MDR6140063.1 hypothetical protein [Pseudoxanthomonas sp. SORGH_AS_0997]